VEITPDEREAVLSKFSVEFFEDMQAAYKEGDRERQIRFLNAYENVLKKLGEKEDKAFEQPRKKLLDKRGSIRAKGRGLKNVVIAEDTESMRQYLEAKVSKQNPTAQIISGPSGEFVLDQIKRQIDKDPAYAPDLVITDIQMLEKGKNLMSGWEFSQKVKRMFPRVMVLVESSVPYPIEAEVEGAISKYDLLFLEYVLDLYEKEYVERRETKGASLGEPAGTPAWTRAELVAAAQRNMESSPVPAYLFLPASLLPKIEPGSVASALRNPSIHLEVLWDTPEGPAERVDRLRALGLEPLLKLRNFHGNTVNQKLDALKSLRDKVVAQSKALEGRGISPKQIGFLKPAALETVIPGVLSLKEGTPYPVFFLLYLIQIEGSPAGDLLRVLTFDPKRGDFSALLDQELGRLLAEQLAVQAAKRAA
jgi:CheY-like chemotaxis protein